LRAAALSKKPPEDKKPKPSGPVETDSALMRTVKRPAMWPVLGAIAILAGAAGYFVARKPAPPPPPTVGSAVVPPPSPAASWGPPQALPPPAAPPAKKRVRAHRAEPLQVATKAKPERGGLPHKTVTTDSKPLEAKKPPVIDKPASPVKVDPGATSAAFTGDAPEETLSDADQKKQAEASIDADGVRFVVKSHLSQVHACYERAFKDSSPGGRVEIGFAIGGDGNAKRVRTEANSTGSDALANCLEGRVKSWQFPRPVGGDYELIYPFVFSPGS
jgi:hypothetical protein